MLRDLPFDGGIILAIAEACALAAVDDLSFPVVVRCAEERG